MSEFNNPFKSEPKPGKPKKSTEKGTPSITKPTETRVESVGEANVKIAEWVISVLGLFRVKFHDFEREALYKAVGPIVRRWPGTRKKDV